MATETKAEIQFLDLVPLVVDYRTTRTWKIRPIRSQDVPAIKSLNDRWLGSKFSKSFYLQFLYDANATCVVAETLDGKIVGCGTAKLAADDASDCLIRGTNQSSPSGDKEGHILTLAVDPSWRRRGIGRDILETLVIQIRALCTRQARLSKGVGQNHSLRAIVLQTCAGNLGALKFYEVCGYQRQGLKKGYYGSGKDAIPMKLSLVQDGFNEGDKMEVDKEKSATIRKWVAVY